MKWFYYKCICSSIGKRRCKDYSQWCHRFVWNYAKRLSRHRSSSFLCGVEVPVSPHFEQLRRRGFVLLPPEVAKLLESDADCEGIEPTSYFVIKSHQTKRVEHREMMWSAHCSLATNSQFEN